MAYLRLSRCLGLLLVGAAVLKLQQPSQAFWIGVIVAELLLGIWLIVGLYAKAARRLALACFSLFFAVSLFKVFRGDASCNCFGHVSVPPWLTAALDASILAALSVVKPYAGHKTRSRFALVPAALLAVPLLIGAYWLRAEEGRAEDGPAMLLEHIDIRDQLRNGEWVVMLHRHDCSTCRGAVRRYEEWAYEVGAQGQKVRAALVEVPPFAGTRPPQRPTLASGKLDDARAWAVPTPMYFRVREGVVTAAAPSLEDVTAGQGE